MSKNGAGALILGPPEIRPPNPTGEDDRQRLGDASFIDGAIDCGDRGRSWSSGRENSSLREVLVVDLDGTLVRSDSLFEAFWSAFAKSLTTPFVAAMSLLGGRAALKRRLTELSRVDVASLPYNNEVVAYIRRWRAEGGRTALVTASDQILADRIAAHLEIFDEVHGSDSEVNLKGARKATFLRSRYGERSFAYMGNARADLHVWQIAAKAITVGLRPRLKAKVDASCGTAEHLTGYRASVKAYVKALRPHQWLKNVLVFVPMVAAHELTSATIAKSVLAFIAFCLVASSVYVLNDLLDLAADRAHPRKRNRPFASGAIPIAHGTWLAPLLLLLGLAWAVPLGAKFILVMLAYYALTTAYSLHLKRRSVIDICTLAGLYTMRVVAGGVATGIPLSVWLLAFCIFLFFSLAAIKRQAELVDAKASGAVTANRRSYHVDDIPVMANMAASAGYVAVLVMALYVNSPAVLELYSRPYALWGICLILLYWISRLMTVTHRGEMHDDPVVYAVKDRVSEVCFLLVAAFVLGGTLL
jgi:4-hydroxybenzoate polyprenyltransferase/phosphoserine phosphatase